MFIRRKGTFQVQAYVFEEKKDYQAFLGECLRYFSLHATNQLLCVLIFVFTDIKACLSLTNFLMRCV